MKDQVKYLEVILNKKLEAGRRILKIGCAKLSCCEKALRIITECGGLAIHFRSEGHTFVCFAGMVEESGAEKCTCSG
jgi:hypothetical protein